MSPDACLDEFRLALTRRAGWEFDDDKLPELQSLLDSRTRETGAKLPADYLERITSHELAELARRLTVSETYFFRDTNQFRVLEHFFATVSETAGPIDILSAGCSSGEEAYSVAIMALQQDKSLQGRVSVLGIDLNPDAIKRAKHATYTAWSLRQTPDPICARYFQKEGSRFILSDDARSMAKFEQHNLVDGLRNVSRGVTFDIIFCRNVLMYLSPTAMQSVVADLARALSPRGLLFLGHAENLRGVSQDFHLHHTHDTFYYSRRDSISGPVTIGADTSVRKTPVALVPTTSPPLAVPPVMNGTWFDAISESTQQIARLSQASKGRPKQTSNMAPRNVKRQPRLTSTSDTSPKPPNDSVQAATLLMHAERFHDALAVLSKASNSQPDALLLRAMLLIGTGDSAGAEEACRSLLQLDELNAGAHYVLSICREQSDDMDGSIEHSHTAAYLDADFAMPHLQLGRLARRANQLGKARRELSLAIGLLTKEDASRIVLFGGGFSREALVQVCLGELNACGGHA